jgi:hypothetical protein
VAPNPMDFFSSIFKAVSPANMQAGGPDIGGIIAGIINQTQAMLGPIIAGMSSGTGLGFEGMPGETFFNQISTQIMGMFNQITRMWSANVRMQLTDWEKQMPKASETEMETPASGKMKNGEREFVLLKQTNEKIKRADLELNEIFRKRRAIKSKSSRYEGREEKGSIDEIVRSQMSTVTEMLRSVWSDIRSFHNSTDFWPFEEDSFEFFGHEEDREEEDIEDQGEGPFFEPGKEMDIDKVLLEMQKEMNELWKCLSKEIDQQRFKFENPEVTEQIPNGSNEDEKAKLQERTLEIASLQESAKKMLSGYEKESQDKQASVVSLQRLRDSMREFLDTKGAVLKKGKEAKLDFVEKQLNQGHLDGVRSTIKDFKSRMEALLNNRPALPAGLPAQP